MKRVISVMVLVCLVVSVLCFVACDDSGSRNTSSSSSSSSYNYSMTDGEKISWAKVGLEDRLRLQFGSNSTYSIGHSSVNSDGDVKFSGQVMRYDSYGQYKARYTFDAVVSVSEKTGTATVVKFKYNEEYKAK